MVSYHLLSADKEVVVLVRASAPKRTKLPRTVSHENEDIVNPGDPGRPWLVPNILIAHGANRTSRRNRRTSPGFSAPNPVSARLASHGHHLRKMMISHEVDTSVSTPCLTMKMPME